MSKIVLLCKRALSDSEKDLLEKHLSCVYFNERVHINKGIHELVANCELLVMDIFKDDIRSYYEGNHAWLKANGVFYYPTRKNWRKSRQIKVIL